MSAPFLARAAASAARSVARWKERHVLPGPPSGRERPPFLPGGVGSFGLIAEVKRRSPSRGEIMGDRSPADLARAYLRGGAEAVSVVVVEEHFGGSPGLFAEVAAAVPLPLLWKDFVVDEYQVRLASALGASAVLLIAAMHDRRSLAGLLSACREAGVRALVEVHDEAEVERALASGADLVGVNNRDLASLQVDLSVSARLAPLLTGRTAVSESGIFTADAAARMRSLGYRAVLVGTALAGAPDPESAARDLLGKG